MKPINANSLRKALAPEAAGTHPDADLLNGFAEGSLLADERRRVVNHLAGCDSCRAAVALASDASPAPQTKIAPARSTRILFRIAIPALTATAAVAVTFLVVHHEPQNTQTNQTAAVHPAATPSSQLTVTSAEPQAHSTATPKPQAPPAPGPRARLAAPVNAPAPSQPVTIAAVPAPIAAPKAEPVPAAAQQTVEVQAEPAANRAAGGPSQALQSFHGVAGLTSGEASSAFSNTVTNKALAKAAATPLARPHWRINHQGQPERAFGSGPWQTVLPADAPAMRVIATDGADVWTGGDNTQLYRSTDNGATWSRVALPEKSGAPHAIAHIQIDSPTDITVRASDGTTWTTSNAGASWK